MAFKAEPFIHWAPEAGLEELTGIHRLAVSNRGVLAGATLNNQLLVLEPDGLKFIAVLDPAENKSLWNTAIHAIAWDLTGESLLVAEGSRITSVEVATGLIQWRVMLKEFLPFMASSALTLSAMPSGSLALATEAGVWQMWSPSGAMLRKRKDHAAPHSVGVTSSGNLLGTDGHVVTEWDGETFEPLRRQFSEGRVHTIAPCPGTPLQWWGKVETNLVLMEFGRDEPLFKIATRPGLPAISTSVDGHEAAWIEENRVMVVLNGGEPRDVIEANARALSVTFLPDGWLASGWADGQIRVARS